MGDVTGNAKLKRTGGILMGKPKRDVDELRDQIEGIILRGAKDFFDAAEDRSALEVTVRICCEFYEFLTNAGDEPDSSDQQQGF